MKQAAGVFWQATKGWYEELFLLAGLAVVWWVLTLLVVTAPPAAAGLHLVANRIVHGRRVSFGLFWEGFQQYFVAGWKVAALDLLALVLLLSNLQFYYSLANPWIRLVTILWLYGLILWLALQFYLFPLLLEQEDRGILLVYRNGLVLLFARPVFALTLLAVVALVSLASFFLVIPLVLAWPPLLALVANRATVTLVEESAALAEAEKNDR